MEIAVRYAQRGEDRRSLNRAAVSPDDSASASGNRKESFMKANLIVKARGEDGAPRFAPQQRLAAD